MTDQRIPVLQLVDGFATEEHPGGAALFGIQFARHLDRGLFAPHICGLWRYNTASEQRWLAQLRSEDIGTTILVDEPGPLSSSLLRAAMLLQLLLNRMQPRIINSHFERGDLLGLWSKVVHPSHPRIVRTMHADQQWQKRPWLGRVLNLVALPWLFDAEVAISQATRETMDRRLAARLRGRHAHLVYNGISSTLLSGDIAQRSAVQTHAPRIVLIGRIEPQKGHLYFLRACAAVLRAIPTLEVWIVGTGSLLDAMQQEAARSGIDHAVRFLGQRSDVMDILGQVDLLVSASLWEGFPTVILEAMAARVPVVATDVSGSRELVRNGETGVLVAVGSPEELAHAMIQQLQNRSQALRMAEVAWHYVQQYSLEQVSATYGSLYQSLLTQNH